jgi:hypothetical protein
MIIGTLALFAVVIIAFSTTDFSIAAQPRLWYLYPSLKEIAMLQQSQTTSVRKQTKKVTQHEPDRASFLRLTLAERRKILREQARKLLDCYVSNNEINGMGGGDFIGC